jgi:hypothetical protein
MPDLIQWEPPLFSQAMSLSPVFGILGIGGFISAIAARTLCHIRPRGFV